MGRYAECALRGYGAAEEPVVIARLEQCSDVLLSIYGAATAASPECFQAAALESLREAIGFESAWWGIMSRTDDHGFALQSSLRADLPDAFEEKWRSITRDDQLAKDATSTPRRTVRFDTRDLRATRGLFELNSEHDIKHALCTSLRLEEEADAFLFVSLFRRGKSRRFEEDDARVKQFLMPHLHAGWRMNLANNLKREAAGWPVLAFIDLRHRVIEAGAQFGDALRCEWPHWSGPYLPAELVDALSRGPARRPRVVGGLSASIEPAGSLRLLVLDRMSVLERLTPREAEVAAQFAAGRSYKEIAKACALAPATVRHHLRWVYKKLGVSDKAQLANAVTRPKAVEQCTATAVVQHAAHRRPAP